MPFGLDIGGQTKYMCLGTRHRPDLADQSHGPGLGEEEPRRAHPTSKPIVYVKARAKNHVKEP